MRIHNYVEVYETEEGTKLKAYCKCGKVMLWMRSYVSKSNLYQAWYLCTFCRRHLILEETSNQEDDSDWYDTKTWKLKWTPFLESLLMSTVSAVAGVLSDIIYWLGDVVARDIAVKLQKFENKTESRLWRE